MHQSLWYCIQKSSGWNVASNYPLSKDTILRGLTGVGDPILKLLRSENNKRSRKRIAFGKKISTKIKYLPRNSRFSIANLVTSGWCSILSWRIFTSSFSKLCEKSSRHRLNLQLVMYINNFANIYGNSHEIRQETYWSTSNKSKAFRYINRSIRCGTVTK